MKSRLGTLAVAISAGILLTAALTFAAYWAYEAGADGAARALSWPNTLLQFLVPCHNIGTAEQPVCEGTPINLLAYFLSFPLSIAVYTTATYVYMRKVVARNA